MSSFYKKSTYSYMCGFLCVCACVYKCCRIFSTSSFHKCLTYRHNHWITVYTCLHCNAMYFIALHTKMMMPRMSTMKCIKIEVKWMQTSHMQTPKPTKQGYGFGCAWLQGLFNGLCCCSSLCCNCSWIKLNPYDSTTLTRCTTPVYMHFLFLHISTALVRGTNQPTNEPTICNIVKCIGRQQHSWIAVLHIRGILYRMYAVTVCTCNT